MPAGLKAILESEFVWGIVIGVVLTGLGTWLQVLLQSWQNGRERLTAARDFAIDTVRNIQRIVGDMEETQRPINAIHHQLLTLFDMEVNVFGRNREHLVSLPLPIRDNVRAYMNDCALIRAQIGGGLTEFNRLTLAADEMQAAGNGPQAQRTRAAANAPLQTADTALDRLVARSQDAAQLITALHGIK